MDGQNIVSSTGNNDVHNANIGNGSISQEVSSTTPTVEVTKRSLRVETWKKIQANKCGRGVISIFNRIPNFVDSEKAADHLTKTHEFIAATNVKVNIDRALNAVRLQALVAGKNLYLPVTRDSSALFLLVDCPSDATDEQRREVLQMQDLRKGRTEITLENKVKLDIIVIGSVVVSRDGYRIGRGNGFADLNIGLLIEVGAITPETVIVTVVHDLQVVDNLPTNLFQKYDTPVDMIVTPTEVIRISKRLPRPAGIFWNILSARRLKIIPVLQQLKEKEEKAGKVIILKEEDTDVENNNKGRGNMQRRPRRRLMKTRNNRRAASHTDNERQENEKPQIQKRAPQYYKRFGNGNRRRRVTKSEGDHSQSAPETKDRRQQRKFYKKRDFCVKVTNIARDIRIKDLKMELRKRECIPAYISWKGQYGKCYLHFATRRGEPNTTADVEKVLKSLSELSLTVQTGEPINDSRGDGESGGGTAAGDAVIATKTYTLNVELMKFDDKPNVGNSDKTAIDANGSAGSINRIEPVDTTTV